jgi:Family of unknown function (DUF6516)
MEEFDKQLLENLDQILEEFGDLIEDKKVEKAKQVDGESILKVRIFLKDQSQLAVYERIENMASKYGYQWMKEDNSLLISWGNDSHHPEISTQPHHKHVGNRQNVQPSEEMNLRKVLLFLGKTIVFFLVLGYTLLYFLAPKASVKAEKAKIEVKKIEKRSKK